MAEKIIADGLCQCGCGQHTTIFKRNKWRNGVLAEVKGRPARFIEGHHSRKEGAGTPTYTVWYDIKRRCFNTKYPQYKDYGGRGIGVCERWLTFKNFLEDMGERPPGLTIERLNNDLGYSPENCVWADRTQQCSNTRRSVKLTLNGRVKTVSGWARELGVSPHTLYSRISLGWSSQRVLAEPIRVRVSDKSRRQWL